MNTPIFHKINLFLLIVVLSTTPRDLSGASHSYDNDLKKTSNIILATIKLFAEKPETKKTVNKGYFSIFWQEKKNNQFSKQFLNYVESYKKYLIQSDMHECITEKLESIKASDLNLEGHLDEIDQYLKTRKKAYQELKRDMAEEIWDKLLRELLSSIEVEIQNISATHRRLINQEKEKTLDSLSVLLEPLLEAHLQESRQLLAYKRMQGFFLLMLDRHHDQLSVDKVKERGEENCCVSCYADDLKESQLLDAFDCGHQMCEDEGCLKSYIRIKQQEKQNLECPICASAANLELLLDKRLLTPLSKSYFEFIYLGKLVRSFSGWVACKTPECEGGYVDEDNGLTRFTCLLCKQNQCMKCSENHNRFINCEDYKEQSHHKDPFHLMKKKGLVKNCPKCKIAISKEEGCLHMTCKACKHEFNWETLEPWSGDRWFLLTNGSRIDSTLDAGREAEIEYR